MNTQQPRLRKSLLALFVGAMVTTPAFAQQQSGVAPPQLDESAPATEQSDEVNLNVSPSATSARPGNQPQSPQPDRVGEDSAVSEAAVDLNVDPRNRTGASTGAQNTLRFGGDGDSAQQPADVIGTEPAAADSGTANSSSSQSQNADGTVAADTDPPAEADNQTEGAAVANEETAEEPAPVAEQPKRMQGVYPLAIDDLTERHVVNSAGQLLGEVEVAVVNEASGDAGLVISVGNLTGIDSVQALAPAEQLHLSGDVLIWQTPHSADQIAEVQAYEPVDYREIVDSYDSLDDASRELSEPGR